MPTDAHAIESCDLLISGGDVVDLEASGASLDDHAVAIVGRHIAAVGPRSELVERWRPNRTIDATGCVVSPGFVDAHVHLSSFLMTPMAYAPATGPSLFGGGAPPEELVTLVAQMTSIPVPAELTETVLRPVFCAALAAGFTSIVDAGGSGLEGIIEAADRTGIRLATGPSLADMWQDEGSFHRRADADELLVDAEAFARAHDGRADGRIRALVSAVETTACSDDLLAGISSLAAEADLPTHVHCLIYEDSDALHEQVHGALTIDRLEATGMLSPRCTAMHAGNADDHAVEVLARTGATVNHNPLGNQMLGWQTLRLRAVPKLLAAGVPVVLGSDYSPTMIPTPFDLMHAALLGHREAGGSDDALLAGAALAMATEAGASMGRPGELGAVRTGQLADLVVLDTSGPHHLGCRTPVPSLTQRGRAADVRTVVVNGEVVVEGGEVTTIDVEAASAEATRLLRSFAA